MGLRPRELGFHMPAEWVEHAATWMSWPFGHEIWMGHLEGVCREFAELVRTLARFEPVHLLMAGEEAERDALARLGDVPAVTRHHVPLDDVWFRDNGPIFVVRPDGAVSFVHWKFNAWGGKFPWQRDERAPEAVADFLGVDHFDAAAIMEGGSLETNGEGVALTTRQCLLAPTRNPSLGEADLERLLDDYLGLRRICWLDRGLEGDHTDGHIDTIARFTDVRTIVACTCDDPQDANFEPLQRNLEVLRAFTDRDGRPFRLVELPLPRARRHFDSGERLPLSYANLYVANGAVLVPQYGDEQDGRALEVLSPLFPGRTVMGLSASEIIHGGGAFHCLTQQQPAGPLWRQPREEPGPASRSERA